MNSRCSPLNAGLYFAAATRSCDGTTRLMSDSSRSGWPMAQAIAARLLWRPIRAARLLSAGAAWVILILAAPIQFAGYRVTVIWAAEAAAMAWIGVRLGERRAVLRRARRARTGARCAWRFRTRGCTASAGEYTALVNARFLAFAAAAAAFWAVAWWIREGRLATGAYTTGHVVMLWGLTLEAVGWAARTASPENFRSVASTAISVIAAAYAVLLVAGGAAWRHAGSRLMGIGPDRARGAEAVPV